MSANDAEKSWIHPLTRPPEPTWPEDRAPEGPVPTKWTCKCGFEITLQPFAREVPQCPRCSNWLGASAHKRVLFIGMAPAKGHDDDPAFERTKSGRNLAKYLGLSDFAEAQAIFDFANTLDKWPGRHEHGGDKFPIDEARRAALRWVPQIQGRRVVLLGKGPRKAFGLQGIPPFIFVEDYGLEIAWCPHPTGKNRWWNDSMNRDRAEVFLRSLVARARMGETTR